MSEKISLDSSENHQLIFIVDKPKSIYLHHTISHIHYISNT